MDLVTDASSLLCLAFQGEAVAHGQRVVDAVRDGGAIVPSIFWYEVRNALLVSERRGRIHPGQSMSFLALLQELPISIEPLPGEAGVLQLARDHQLSVYDAAYLELALRERLPLATLDRSLAEAAGKCGVPIWGRSSQE